MILNLDKTFHPFPKEKSIDFELFTFSGGEPHIQITSNLENIAQVTITHRIQSFNNLGFLLIAVNALRNMGVKELNLFLPYFPGARQDRIMIKGEALTVKVYADLINSLKFDKVIIFDAHSDVTPALLNNCTVLENYTFIKKVTKKLKGDIVLISPDGGALKKIYKVAKYLQKKDVVACSKSRDVKTGKISNFKVHENDLKNKPCLIVDDICDGGRTFIGLAKELKKKNAGKLYLAVSHGIFSKGLEELNKHFETIFITNSFKDLYDKNVVQIKIEEII